MEAKNNPFRSARLDALARFKAAGCARRTAASISIAQYACNAPARSSTTGVHWDQSPGPRSRSSGDSGGSAAAQRTLRGIASPCNPVSGAARGHGFCFGEPFCARSDARVQHPDGGVARRAVADAPSGAALTVVTAAHDQGGQEEHPVSLHGAMLAETANGCQPAGRGRQSCAPSRAT